MSKKVLIAEDDKAILEVVKIILQDGGYEVIAIEDGEQVLPAIQQHQPHIVLLDIWMAGSDGGEIAKNVKKNEKTKHIPIVMVSANNETEVIAKQVGANDFLQKPFNIDDLLQVIQKHILPTG